MTQNNTLSHRGVKGMRWGVRKNYASGKYKPVGTTSSGKLQVKKKHIFARTKTLSKRQSQRMADDLFGTGSISYKKAFMDPYTRKLVNERILSELAVKASK